jgi:Tfp pilus assembly protein PilO
MKNIWKKHKAFVIVFAYAAAIVLAVYFAFMPIVADIKKTSDEIQAKIIDGQIEEAKLAKIPQLEKDMEEYNGKKDNLDEILVSGSEVGFIENMESIAGATGNAVSLKIVDNQKPATPSKDSKAKSILGDLNYKNYFSMEVTLKGNYQSLADFIHSFENMKYYADIISVNVKKDIVQNATAAPASTTSSSDLFSGSLTKSAANQPAEKDTLDTILSVVVYTQK